MTSYRAELVLAWSVRAVLFTSLIAIAAILSGCGHTLNTSSTGTLSRDPPVSTQSTN